MLREGRVDYIKMIIPMVGAIVATIAGVLIGIYVNGRRERKAQRQERDNIRYMLYHEVTRIHDGAMSFIERRTQASSFALKFFELTPIYDAYLGKFSALSSTEVQHIDSLYCHMAIYVKWIEEGKIENARNTLDLIATDSDILLTFLKRHIKTEGNQIDQS